MNGDLEVDIMSHRVAIRGRELACTPTEEAVLYILTRHAGKLVTCRHLLRCVWGSDSEDRLHDLHVYIRSLRRKLNGAGNESVIHTEGSAGYRLLLPIDCHCAPAQSASPKMISAAA
jgi:two-component system KDP operon response regulator KdpE